MKGVFFRRLLFNKIIFFSNMSLDTQFGPPFQDLKPNDHQIRLTFDKWTQTEMTTDPVFYKKNLFRDGLLCSMGKQSKWFT